MLNTCCTLSKNILRTFSNIPKLKEEFRTSLVEEKSWIKSLRDKENSLLLIAEYDDIIVGNIDLTGHSRKIMQHTAVIGMGMLAEWRNIGLGSALMKEAIQWAKANPILEVLWLQVYTDNELGVGLYRKMGFKENGIIKNFFKHGERYYDNLTMSLDVK